MSVPQSASVIFTEYSKHNLEGKSADWWEKQTDSQTELETSTPLLSNGQDKETKKSGLKPEHCQATWPSYRWGNTPHTRADSHASQVHTKTFTKIDHVWGHKINLDKFQRTEIISIGYVLQSQRNEIKVINKKTLRKSRSIYKLNTLLNNPSQRRN